MKTAGFAACFLIACLCATAASALYAQGPSRQQAGPRFDVASVRVVRPGEYIAEAGFHLTPGRFRAADLTLGTIIRYAYSAPQYETLQGGPEWLHYSHQAARFVVEATFSPQASPEQVRAMLRALLANRFKLVMHSTTTHTKVYQLTTAGAPKLKPYLKGSPPPRHLCPLNGQGYGLETFRLRGTVAAFTTHLANAFRLPVVDKTNLKGEYWFSFCYVEPGYHQSPTLPPPPSIESAVRRQLGLVLQSTKGEIKTYIVDHAEMPSPN